MGIAMGVSVLSAMTETVWVAQIGSRVKVSKHSIH